MALARSGGKGFDLEEALRAYFWHAGYFVVRGLPYRADGDDVTDGVARDGGEVEAGRGYDGIVGQEGLIDDACSIKRGAADINKHGAGIGGGRNARSRGFSPDVSGRYLSKIVRASSSRRKQCACV